MHLIEDFWGLVEAEALVLLVLITSTMFQKHSFWENWWTKIVTDALKRQPILPKDSFVFFASSKPVWRNECILKKLDTYQENIEIFVVMDFSRVAKLASYL